MLEKNSKLGKLGDVTTIWVGLKTADRGLSNETASNILFGYTAITLLHRKTY